MLQSKLFLKTKKEAPKEATALNHKLLVRGDFIEQTISGVYRFLPLGLKVLKKIEQIIRKEMVDLGGQEICLPALQDKKLWQESGRWDTFDPPLFKLKDRHQKETALGPTHEEEVVDLARRRIKSYNDLPVYLFQIQSKFRNEMRSGGGLLRGREFLMKDLYSFHANEKDLAGFYEKVRKSYLKIFKKCGIQAICVQASSGSIGGKTSHEFMTLSEAGEDRILICRSCGYAANIEKIGEARSCPECGKDLGKESAIELGHIFYLDAKYSQPMKALFRDKDGKQKPVLMGCYGIGVSRVMAAVAEIYNDEKGIIWPKEIAPLQIHLIRIENSPKIKKAAAKLYSDLQGNGVEVLYDDRDSASAGEKFADCDLLGIPLRVVVSEKTLEKDSLEIKKRRERKTSLLKIKDLSKYLSDNYGTNNK